MFRHTHYSSTSFLHSHIAIPLTFKVSIKGLVEVLLLCGFPFCLWVLVWGSGEKRSGEASRDSGAGVLIKTIATYGTRDVK